MMKMSWTATAAAGCALALSLELIAVAGWFRTSTPQPTDEAQLKQNPVKQSPAPRQPVTVLAQQPELAKPVTSEDRYYAKLRPQIRWVETRFGGDQLLTPDYGSRMLLTKSAAQRAKLHEVGLSYQDVYGIINAETSWVPRMGASKDGTPNLGIAQFEPATAKGLGLRNPNDPVEAIHVAAVHMKEAAEWSAKRIAGLKLKEEERAQKLREGVSIFYNLSVKGRNKWNGNNTAKLPIETQLHIRNARNGAQYAAKISAQMEAEQVASTSNQQQLNSGGIVLTGG